MVLKLAQVWCAAWLAFQFLIPLVPTWGAFIPHDHWARQTITAAEMDAHWDEHRLGKSDTACTASRTADTQILSTIDPNGLSSLTEPLADVAQNVRHVSPPLKALGKFCAHEFFERAFNNSPLVPPPNRVARSTSLDLSM